MQFHLKRHAIVACLLLSPFAAFAADIEINGTCIQGTCPPPAGTSDALQFGQSNASPGSTPSPYSLMVNGDTYSISWTYSDSFTSGTEIVINPVATFVSGPSTTTDTITFDFFQNYYTNISNPTWDGTYTETVPLDIEGPVASGSTASGELFYDGQGLGLVGPVGPGFHYKQNMVALTGLDLSTLSAEYEFTYTFAPGTTGGSISSPSIPEPAETLPLALLGLGSCGFALRRRAKSAKM
jgi:hypothetical protein